MFKIIVAIGIGGALGTLLRYGINLSTLATGLPLGTVIENLSGSLLLGALTGFFALRTPKEWVKAGLGVGLCGGYTTFSTIASDTFLLADTSSTSAVALYITITLFGGVLLAFAGFLLGERIAKSSKQPQRGQHL
ncbi:fluoride efflux transporter FluC [Salsuginibacillus kocurii]|uniref:fluoride efflux transporter FluC n=1 Tax=Salsuginibacillus kocurii TaxID=427078 RepID=UPI00036FDB25|nr:CrcB family protein [Salsuginibacillus kocurii]